MKVWSEGEWPRRSTAVVDRERPRSHLTVVDAEFALWTWYRLAYIDGTKAEQRQHPKNFYLDPWVQDRRAQRIPDSLGQVGRLCLARSYLYTEPTVAAIIAWRELETAMRKTLLDLGKTTTDKDDFEALLGILPDSAFPRNLRKYGLRDLWHRRNPVMHKGEEIAEGMTARRIEATRVLNGVVEFIGKNNADFHQWGAIKRSIWTCAGDVSQIVARSEVVPKDAPGKTRPLSATYHDRSRSALATLP